MHFHQRLHADTCLRGVRQIGPGKGYEPTSLTREGHAVASRVVGRRGKDTAVESASGSIGQTVKLLLGDSVGPVERVVQTRPPTIGGLSRITPLRVDLPDRYLHLVLKEPRLDPSALAIALEIGAHEREYLLLRSLRDVSASTTLPVHGAALDASTRTSSFLFQDAGPQSLPDQEEGAPQDLAVEIVRCLAHFHRLAEEFTVPGRQFSGGWQNSALLAFASAFAASVPRFLDQYGDDLTPYSARVTERLARQLPGLVQEWSEVRPTSLIHGDARLANVVRWNERVWLIDWQMASRGEPVFDLVHFMVGSMTVETRRAGQAALLDAYVDEYGRATRSAAEEDLRRLLLLTIPINVVFGVAPASASVAKSRREVIRRYWTAVDEYESGDFLL